MSETRRWPRILGVTATLLSLATRSAWAQSPEEVATDRFKQAVEAYARKDFRAAAIAFESAEAAVPAGATAYNAALAWVAAGEPVHAANDFAAAIELGRLTAVQVVDAGQRLEALEKEVGHLDIMGPPAARAAVDGVGEVPLPSHVRVAPGPHSVSMTRADGSTDVRRVHVARGASARIDFVQPPAPEPPVTPPVVAAPPPPLARESAPPPPSRPPAFPQRTLGWSGLGAGVGLSVTAIVLGVVGLNAKNDFVTGGDHDQSLHDRAVTLRTLTNVCWVGAGLIGAGGVVLLVTAPKAAASESKAGATLRVGATGLTFAGSF